MAFSLAGAQRYLTRSHRPAAAQVSAIEVARRRG